MKLQTKLPIAEHYALLRPLDKLVLILIIDDAKKGVRTVVKTRYADNSLTTLSYAGFVQAEQFPGEYPTVIRVSSRGLRMAKYIQDRETLDELTAKLPEPIVRRMRG